VLNLAVVNPWPQNSPVVPDVGVDLVDEDLVRHDDARLGDVHVRRIPRTACGAFVQDFAVAGLDELAIVAVDREVEVAMLDHVLQLIICHAFRVTLRRVAVRSNGRQLLRWRHVVRHEVIPKMFCDSQADIRVHREGLELIP